MRIEYHRTLLADRVRNAALYGALKALIRPGETTVADIGAGTGVIGLMAARLGAREVYLYEQAAVAGVAEKILKQNRARQCRLIPFSSREVGEPPRVDLVVSETLGNYALEEDIITTLNDARRRFLKPGGVIVPSAITQFIAPVTAGRVHAELTAWDEVGFGLDFSAARTMSLNNAYVRSLAPADLLGQGKSALVWDRIDFGRENRTGRKGEARWPMTGAATIFGFALWWTADLAPGVGLSTAPDAPRTHWEQLYLPLLEPVMVKPAEVLLVTVRSRSSPEEGTNLAWTAVVLDKSGKPGQRQALDLERGHLD
jgi:protein arginine N-methyltransferase 1